ncbi:serine 3-dehydrogenase [Moniliophthora roreri]|nr:serine 3-dehydrogenase [Moniliophthora roreri]
MAAFDYPTQRRIGRDLPCVRLDDYNSSWPFLRFVARWGDLPFGGHDILNVVKSTTADAIYGRYVCLLRYWHEALDRM